MNEPIGTTSANATVEGSSRRSAVVTGSGRGIGRACLERLVVDGWHVIGIESSAESAHAQQDWATATGAGVEIHIADVRDPHAHVRAADAADSMAPLLGWVNNAGVATMSSLLEPDIRQISETLDVDLLGYYWGCSAAVRAFVTSGRPGAIVNISSIHARAAFPGYSAYSMAKAGVNALTRCVAVEFGEQGIRANAVEPGAIRTSLAQRLIDESPDPASLEGELARLHPIGRRGEPEEVAAVVAFLLSDRATFVSGASIPVDGAATARCYAFPAAGPPATRAEGGGT